MSMGRIKVNPKDLEAVLNALLVTQDFKRAAATNPAIEKSAAKATASTGDTRPTELPPAIAHTSEEMLRLEKLSLKREETIIALGMAQDNFLNAINNCLEALKSIDFDAIKASMEAAQNSYDQFREAYITARAMGSISLQDNELFNIAIGNALKTLLNLKASLVEEQVFSKQVRRTNFEAGAKRVLEFYYRFLQNVPDRYSIGAFIKTRLEHHLNERQRLIEASKSLRTASTASLPHQAPLLTGDAMINVYAVDNEAGAHAGAGHAACTTPPRIRASSTTIATLSLFPGKLAAAASTPETALKN